MSLFSSAAAIAQPADLVLRGGSIWPGKGLPAASAEPGKLADLVVFETDVLRAPPRELLKANVDMTVVGGRVVFERR